jgi:hypothetical protein
MNLTISDLVLCVRAVQSGITSAEELAAKLHQRPDADTSSMDEFLIQQKLASRFDVSRLRNEISADAETSVVHETLPQPGPTAILDPAAFHSKDQDEFESSQVNQPQNLDRTMARSPGTESQFDSGDIGEGQGVADRYELIRIIGGGGMGTVRHARQTEPVDRDVARN